MNNNPCIPNTNNGKPFNDQIIEILISAGEILTKSKNCDLKPIFKSKKEDKKQESVSSPKKSDGDSE